VRNVLRNELAIGVYVLAMLCAGPSLGGIPRSSGCEDDMDLQIVTDKSSYAPGAVMHVKFLITNTSEKSLYLFRSVNQCSSPLGWLSVEIRDQRNEKIPTQLCSGEFDMDALNVVQALASFKSGVQLLKGEIYGRVQDYQLPKRKGAYRLYAEIAPASLTENQKQELSQHQMRVLRNICQASVVTITVK
jgi:hypothetical protein